MFPYGQLSVIKHHQFYTYIAVLVTVYAHSLPREFVRYLTKKHTVFKVIIKVTEKLVIHRRTNIDN